MLGRSGRRGVPPSSHRLLTGPGLGQLLGPIPTELGTLRSLTWLEMNGNGNHTSNQVSGTLPTQMGRLSNAVRVVVQV